MGPWPRTCPVSGNLVYSFCSALMAYMKLKVSRELLSYLPLTMYM